MLRRIAGRSRLAIIIFVVIAVASFLALPARADSALDAIERAIGLLSTHEVDAARLTLIPAGDGESPDALLLAARGIVEACTGDGPAAEVAYRRALDRDPKQLAALCGFSLCLLKRGRVFEATTLVERAAVLAPDDARVKVLLTYVYMLLGRLTDAAQAGKAALEGGEQSTFLLSTLAQLHYHLGYTRKALDFGHLAANAYNGMDFLAPLPPISLPLMQVITDTPQALSNLPTNADAPKPSQQRTDLEIDVPKPKTLVVPQKMFEIAAPRSNMVVRGLQRVRVVYRGTREVKFVVLQVDRIMRGMLTEMPYHFIWDADNVLPGEHELRICAYDSRGVVVEEDAITVTTLTGTVQNAPEPTGRARELQQRLIGLIMPSPLPRSLFMQLGWWHRSLGETPQAVAAFEKAAAIDPSTEGVLGALAQLYQANGLHPLSPTNEISCGPADGPKRVALTFDDGPNPLYTPNILSELKRFNAHATFFLVGKMVQQYPELATQILTEGHELANHSYTHPNMTKLKQQEIIAEVLRTRAVIKEVTGQQTYLFRPPGGNIDPFVTKQLRALDYNITYWDINAGEYRKLPPEKQASQIVDRVKPGSILLLHNGLVDGTLNILIPIITELSRRGYTFVTVSELLTPAPKTPAGNGKAPTVPATPATPPVSNN